MAVPDFQSFMRPLLVAVEDGKVIHLNEVQERIAKYFNLSEEEIQAKLPSGKQTYFKNRCGWARTYMKKAGLIEQPTRGYVQITSEGRKALSEQPDKIDIAYLKSISGDFKKFHVRKAKPYKQKQELENTFQSDPGERLEEAFQEIEDSLISDLLDQIKSNSWQFFEKLVLDLMLAMGYGGSARHTRFTNDDGIDGVINEDKLGLDTIYLQAKKWSNRVSRPEIDKFIGALTRQGARKGVFITTSDFSSSAYDATNNLAISIVLIDGKQLAELMIQNGVGVTVRQEYHIKDIDADYFME